MRRLSRLDRSVQLLRTRSPSSLCSACGGHTPFSTAVRRAAQDGQTTFTENMRRKIWGTDRPPGQADAYGGLGNIEKKLKPGKQKEETAQQKEEVLENEVVQQRRAPVTQALSDDYAPADTWDGLVEVGEVPAEDYHFEGYLPAETATNRYEITAALHRAVVEVFTLRQGGIPLSQLARAGRGGDNTAEVQVLPGPSTESGPVLEFRDPNDKELILHGLRSSVSSTEVYEQDVEADMPNEDSASGDFMENPPPEVDRLTPSGYRQQVASWNPQWLKVSIADLDVKFAIIKRVLQLTGIRIPDSVIASANSPQALLIHLIVPPTPEKLADVLAKKTELVKLPNVQIFHRRITPIDRERSVGRWKVIERELRRRELPVTGH